MARIKLELRDACGTKSLAVRLDDSTLGINLLSTIAKKIGHSEKFHNLSDGKVPGFLYNHHRSVFDLSLSIKDNGIKSGDRLRYYFPSFHLDTKDVDIQVDFTDEITILEEGDQIDIAIEGDVTDQIILKEESRERSFRIMKSKISIINGDITNQIVDAIVNAAKPSLAGGGGVDQAIHEAAGPDLVKSSRDLAPCKPGEAVITPGFNLLSNWVIHTVGPVYEGNLKNEAEILASAYRNSLRIAMNSKFDSVAFPSISTGYYGYPVKEASEVALETISEVLSRYQYSLFVIVVLNKFSDFQEYETTCQRLMIDTD